MTELATPVIATIFIWAIALTSNHLNQEKTFGILTGVLTTLAVWLIYAVS